MEGTRQKCTWAYLKSQRLDDLADAVAALEFGREVEAGLNDGAFPSELAEHLVWLAVNRLDEFKPLKDRHILTKRGQATLQILEGIEERYVNLSKPQVRALRKRFALP